MKKIWICHNCGMEYEDERCICDECGGEDLEEVAE